MSLLPTNSRILEYLITEHLGSGGFANTYLATDVNLNKLVAIKELFPRSLCERGEDYVVRPLKGKEDAFRSYLRYFLKEAQVLARFDERNIVKVLRYFEGMGTAFIIMEFVDGRDLAEYCREVDVVDEGVFDSWLAGILKGLQAVHDANVIHGDIKPRNIIIDRENQPVLIDFGAAVIHQMMRDGEVGQGEVFLTSGYAAPEQFVAEAKVDHRIDIYALGAVFHEIVAREKYVPEPEGKPVDLLSYTRFYNQKVLQSIGRALSPQAEDRFEQAQDWLDFITLSRSERLGRWLRRNKAPVAAAAGLAIVAGLATDYAIRNEIDLQNFHYKIFASTEEVARELALGKQLERKANDGISFLAGYATDYRGHIDRLNEQNLISGRNGTHELRAHAAEVDRIAASLTTERNKLERAARRYYFADFQPAIARADEIVAEAAPRLDGFNRRLLAAVVENEAVQAAKERNITVRKADLAALMDEIRDKTPRFLLDDIMRRVPPHVESFLRQQQELDARDSLEAHRARVAAAVKDMLQINHGSQRARDLQANIDKIKQAGSKAEIDALHGDAARIVGLIVQDREKAVQLQAELRQENVVRAVVRDIDTAMLRLEGGSFRMGGEGQGFSLPIHDVSVRPFFLARNEVTIAQWNMCVGDKACRQITTKNGDEFPITGVTWDDAKAFVEWLNRKTSTFRYRLPSEAEWEFVVKRHGFRVKELASNIEPVTVDLRNNAGINAIVGNALEWLEDCWHGGYHGAPADGSAWNTGLQCDRRVVRGGNWGNTYALSEANIQFFRPMGMKKNETQDALGFRLAGDRR